MKTSEVQTIVIDNFSGRLTRQENGDLNSGYADFEKTWGCDPFTKPGDLTFGALPSKISPSGPLTSSILVLDGKTRYETPIVGSIFAYVLGQKSGATNLFKIKVADTDGSQTGSVVLSASVMATNPVFQKGGSLDFYQTGASGEQIYVGSDNQVNVINTDGSGDALIHTASPGSLTSGYFQSQDRPILPFLGKLLIGNGQTVANIDSTNQLVSSIIGFPSVVAGNATAASALIPPLPSGWFVRDIEQSPDFNYANILACQAINPDMNTKFADFPNVGATKCAIFQWNGVTQATTAGSLLPVSNATAIQSFLSDSYVFGADSIGMNLLRNAQKIWTLPFNNSPYRNSVGSNGNFVFWVSIEGVPNNAAKTNFDMYASLYYYGSMDEQTPPGLYRIMRQATSLSGGHAYKAPMCILVSNTYISLVSGGSTTAQRMGQGAHYFSLQGRSSANVIDNSLYVFKTQPLSTDTAMAGVYQTQKQLFPKRITVKQVRVYTEPTASSDAFDLDLIGSDGSPITGGEFNYTFAAGSDSTTLLGSLERIDFNPTMAPIYTLGVRITNTGQTPELTIKKIEIDYTEQGK